ncbi:MAG: hypothetical protein KME13_22145 [Myxacorys californica WJT36-NPBG1]|nr:hypothetical protein [Myxacorys californica WJT36-NPBG1]
MNALIYVADNGIKWQALPHDFLARQTKLSLFRNQCPVNQLELMRCATLTTANCVVKKTFRMY